MEEDDRVIDNLSSPSPASPLNFINPNFQYVREDEINCNTAEAAAAAAAGHSDSDTGSAGSVGDGDDSYQDAHIYEDITSGTFTRRASVKSRAAYHRIDVSSMGVDVHLDPSTNLDKPHTDTSKPPADTSTEQADLDKGVDNGGHVRHIKGPVNEDLYAVVSKGGEKEEEEDELIERPLPGGWQKHEDEEGPYYWHIKSGTIQREPPTPDIPLSASRDMLRQMVSAATSPMSPSTSDYALQHIHSSLLSASKSEGDNAASKKNVPGGSSRVAPLIKLPSRFAVRSLGWVEISEGDLTPERSSRAVNRCIVDLSLGKNDLLDAVGRWGEGKDLYLELDYTNLKLLAPQDLRVVHVQPIHSIRVWGVGRDNNRDFAYVSRDRVTKRHMCHVFRCDSSAKLIANTLRDICRHLMSTKSTGATSSSGQPSRPSHLPTTGHRSRNPYKQMNITSPLQSFPTPMEEPKKILKAHYLGSVPVSKPTGMDILNHAIEELMYRQLKEEWQYVHVAVAPSTVTVQEPAPSEEVIVECRVRFLSFLGIGQDVKTCAFIVHTAADQFVCHAFHCEPSSGALCKTIEAACKLRYQKCLDAQQNREKLVEKQQQQQQSEGTKLAQNVASGLKSVWGQLGQLSRKIKSVDL